MTQLAGHPVSPSLAQAARLHQSGRLAEAESIYREILSLNPNQPEILHLLGELYLQTKNFDSAIEIFSQAIRLKPYFASAHNNLGVALKSAGKPTESQSAFRAALAANPNFAPALNNLASALIDSRQFAEATEIYRRFLQLNSNHAPAWNNLGIALYECGQFNESLEALRRAIGLRPEYAEALNNLGNTLRGLGNFPDTLAAYQKACELKPEYAQAYNNPAVALWESGSHDRAVAAARKALELLPGFPEAHNTLGNILRDCNDFDEAASHYESALELNPDYAEAHANLAIVLKDQARFDEALFHARRAVAIRPDHAAHSNLIYLLHFQPDFDETAITREQANWHRVHAKPLAAKIPSHDNDRDPNRRLRIAYIAPYFRRHVVGLNILPLLRGHNHENFEIFCYSDALRPDSITSQCEKFSDGWRNIVGQSDAKVAELIRQDKIDILIDLSLHLSGNRLLVLARKPAPIQITFAGYPGRTGLKTIDYRFTDPYLDPPRTGESVEHPIPLPSFWCYDESAMTHGLAEIPQTNPLPAQTAGYITFGCLNNFCKVNDRVLQLWSRVLQAVPNSRMILLAPAGSARRSTANRFAQLGIATDRLEFVGHYPRREYLNLYQRIDITLDTFPYNGHTTSLDSLWMGVPVITPAGTSPVGRAGVSQLSNLGLTDLIAQTPDDFVKKAADLAAYQNRLSEIRSTLRQKMRNSPLMDMKLFAREIENAYRAIWTHWRQKKGPTQ